MNASDVRRPKEYHDDIIVPHDGLAPDDARSQALSRAAHCVAAKYHEGDAHEEIAADFIDTGTHDRAGLRHQAFSEHTEIDGAQHVIVRSRTLLPQEEPQA